MKNLIRPLLKLFVLSFLTGMWMKLSAQQSTGLNILDFTVAEGKVVVYLPPFFPYQTLSGSMYLIPNGDTSRNGPLLRQYNLRIQQLRIPVSNGSFRFGVSANGGKPVAVDLVNNGHVIKTGLVSVALPSILKTKDPVISRYMVAGEPAVLAGGFDGDLANTTLTINGKAVSHLAESPEGIYFQTTSGTKGPVPVSCTDGESIFSGQTNLLNLDLVVGRTNLKRGQKTDLRLAVSGLEGMEEAISVKLENTTPSIVTLQGGNTQFIRVSPPTNGGVFDTTLQVQSITTGTFSLSASILPSDQPTTSVLCNCFIQHQTHLLPPAICLQLGGNCNHPLPDSLLPEPMEATDPLSQVNFSANENLHEARIGPIQLTVTAPNLTVVHYSVSTPHDNVVVTLGAGIRNGNTWTKNWDPPLGNDGVYNFHAFVADSAERGRKFSVPVRVIMTPEIFNPAPNEVSNLSISDEQVKNAQKKADAVSDSIRASRRRLDSLQVLLDSLKQAESEKRDMVKELERIDKVLESLPGIYKDSVDAALKRVENPGGQGPGGVSLVDDAAQRLKDCRDRLEALKKEKADLEKEREDLVEQQEKILQELTKLLLDNGWTGGYGRHSDGRFWFGYIGDENVNDDINPQRDELVDKFRKLKKKHLAANKRLKQLEEDIANAEKDCAELEKALAAAQQAANNVKQAAEQDLAEICRQLKSLIGMLGSYSSGQPGLENLKSMVQALLAKCPGNRDEWNRFFEDLDKLIQAKKEKEKQTGNEADGLATAGEEVAKGINDEKAKGDGLQDEHDRLQDEADRLAEERAKELEAEREKARKKEEERKRTVTMPKPAPTLEEPVDPSDDQLKFQAQIAFKSLYLDMLLAHGPCDCRTKAIALANNTNTIVSDIIGRIGIGVAFAPLEAFPGLSLGSRLGIGAAKAIGSALFGGQNFPEELAKNLFDVIGGEIFPKLVGNEFVGGQLNDLAGQGLEAILEAEGVRSISWEGETTLRDCGKVKGKTLMLVNPNTGWVTIIIQVDDCPPVVIKYKVNDDGVPITEPTVHVVK